MNKTEFVYVTYIRTTPTKLWKALTDPTTIGKYWFGLRMETDWKEGSNWRFFYDDQLMDSGKVLRVIPRRLLVRSWQNQWKPELKKEGISRCTYEITKVGDSTKLEVTHTISKANSKFIRAVAEGWPMCLSNLKSLLETKKTALTDHPGHED